MICPDCGHDNIAGDDLCEACGNSLTVFDEVGNALERGITGHAIDLLCIRAPVHIATTASVRDAVSAMVDSKTGCVLVEQDGNLAGIFTERDVLYKISPNLGQLDDSVSDHMTANPETITKKDTIAYALHAMDIGGYRHMPVVEEAGASTGVVSVRDIMRFLCVRYAQSRD